MTVPVKWLSPPVGITPSTTKRPNARETVQIAHTTAA